MIHSHKRVRKADAVAFGKLLRSLRRRKKLTQSWVGAKLDLSPQAISYMERGTRRMTAAELVALLDATNISLPDFLGIIK